MEGREAQISSSGSKCGGWITFPFITSLSLKHIDTHRHTHHAHTISYIYLYQAGAVAGLALGSRMDGKLDRISNSGVQCEKHRCCSDFKHNEWLLQSDSGHWSNCC